MSVPDEWTPTPCVIPGSPFGRPGMTSLASLTPRQTQQIRLRVNPPVMPIRKRDVQPIAEIADFRDRDARKLFREAAVEAGARAVGAFAGEAECFRGHAQRVAL